MLTYKESWKARIAEALNTLLPESVQGPIDPSQVIAEVPPQPELGDLGFPLFPFAKLLRQSPLHLAQAVVRVLDVQGTTEPGDRYSAEGPYVNVHLHRGRFAQVLFALLLDKTRLYGRPETLKGSRIMVEFSSPNTNKPLHLGHLRNDILGESISRILMACGAEVRKVCIINDRGVHICKSMLAYKEAGNGQTPASEGVKSDHFVGDWYVRFHQMSRADPQAEARAQALLRQWEAGDQETVALWTRMNTWAVEGIKETYQRTGISFDQFYFESQTYLKGKAEVLNGLEQGLFYKEADGAVWVDLSAEQLDKKVLLRKDGTSLYITQDIGTAIFRYQDWPFDRLIYVVGSEQQYHFKVLFSILEKLRFEWAKNGFHLSYGMVHLPEGKMKSREGTVVDADDLLDRLKSLALKEIRDKEREEVLGDPEATAEKIALGALHYYLLQVSPVKDMLFKPQESLAFNGNTGPYLQYMGARISSLLYKQDQRKQAGEATGTLRPELLVEDAEWELLKTLGEYPEVVAEAAERLDPSVLTSYLYELSKAFSRFYHDCPILNATPDLTATRIGLSQGVLQVLQDALYLTGIPFLAMM
jgi:arginyl-tRNA synthetase